MSDALIREVHEDLQRDRAIAFAKRYGGYLAALVLALVLGTAAYVGWNHWRSGVRADESSKLLAAMGKLDKGEAGAALTEFLAVAEQSSDGVAAVARFQAAQAATTDGKSDQATEILGAVAEGAAGDPILKEAALVATLGRRLYGGEPAALIAELEPLTGADRAFRHQAREFLALAKLRAGDRDGAKATLDDALKDPSLPPGARSRLTELRAALEIVV